MITPRWPNTPLSKYPHLAGSDIPTWDAWIRMYGHNFLGFDYDIHIGHGLKPNPGTPSSYAADWTILTQKRLDVLGYRPGEIWLIEVKHRPMTASIGQVLSYDILYKADFKPKVPIVLCMIAGIIEPDIETVLRHFNIRFYDLSDGHSFLKSPTGPPLKKRAR